MPEDSTRIVLVSCVSQKLSHRARAQDLYTSPLFRFNLQYAKQLSPDAIYIISAKYGLLNLDVEIEPYNLTLKDMRLSQVKAWAQNTLEEIKRCTDINRSHFIFLAGERYRKYLLPYLNSYEIPMAGLPIGKQLRFLKGRIHE